MVEEEEEEGHRGMENVKPFKTKRTELPQDIESRN